MQTIKFSFVVFMAMVLAGCQQTYIPQAQQVDLTGSPYILNVASVNVAEEYQSSKTPPHVELLSDIPPAKAIKQWADAKLVASGSNGYAEFVIKDARIVKKALPKQKSGIEGYFTNEQTEQYDGFAEVELKIYDGKRTLPAASIRVSSRNSRTLPENATIVDRKNIYHDMSIELMQLLEKQLRQNIRAHLNNYLM